MSSTRRLPSLRRLRQPQITTRKGRFPTRELASNILTSPRYPMIGTRTSCDLVIFSTSVGTYSDQLDFSVNYSPFLFYFIFDPR